MPNLRIIFDNKADSATVSVSNGTNAANMQNDYKGKIHRSSGTTVSYTLTWASQITLGGVALPATNLTSDATIRVRAYITGAPDTLVTDSSVIYACPGQTLELWNWSQPLNANAFFYGGASKTAVWFNSPVACDKVVIDLVDTNNPAGYIDCARLVVGNYWEPKFNMSNGAQVTINDISETVRNDTGDLLADRGIIHDMISFDFSLLLDEDRLALTQLLRKIGTSRNFLMSTIPDNNSILEQTYMIYGKRTNSSINMELYGIYSHSMEIEGW